MFKIIFFNDINIHFQVKLKCVEARGSVSIYLLEPYVCQYILGIESSLVCEFIDKVDENGLVKL